MYELCPTIIKLINFIVVMDFSTAVTLESFFLTLGGVSILFSSEDILALWFAGALRCILNASGNSPALLTYWVRMLHLS